MHVASFPDSTPQLFIHSAIKSWGVESRNEARTIRNMDSLYGCVSAAIAGGNDSIVYDQWQP